MADLFRWLAASEEHPLITSSVFHYEFEFIHPFADGNGRMGRLWQTLILTRWNPLFADVPVESLVHEHQADYYQALQKSTDQTDSAPFIEFMLRMILDAVSTVDPPSRPPSRPPSQAVAAGHPRRNDPRGLAERSSNCRIASHSASAISSHRWLKS